MHRTILLVVLALLSAAASADNRTLGRPGVVGTWQSVEPDGAWTAVQRLFREPRRDTLVIGQDLSVRFERHGDGSATQVLVAAPGAVTFDEDLMIVTFEQSPLRARLVATGWRSASRSLLLAQLYLYDQDGLFNGIPMTFQRSAPRP